MGESVSLSYSFLQKFFPVTGMGQTYALVELIGKGQGTERPPVNLAVVLDKSGSMSGRPLHYCKEAVKFIISQLQEKDILSVVAFNDEVETILEPQEVKHKDLLKNQIDKIETGGMTNLSGGLIAGCRHLLKQNTKEYVNRLILLSDGQANRGITDIGQLMKVVDDFNASGAVISTMGVSDHFNEELMEGVADRGKGNYYFIDEVEQIPKIFEHELDGLLSVIAQGAELKITPKNGARITNVFGYLAKNQHGTMSVSLGDMYTNESKSVLLEISVPAQPEGSHDIFQFEWSFVDVTDGVKDCRYSLTVPGVFTADLAKLTEKHSHVEKQVEITKSAQSLEEAMKLFDEGDFEKGKEILYNQAVSMQQKADALQDDELKEEAKILFSQMENFHYSSNKRKELHQQKYRQMKRRKQQEQFPDDPALSKIKELKSYLDNARHAVVFTGAGMSTEAGLPDFRSASSGMWNGIDPMKLASTDAMQNNREQFIAFYRNRIEGLRAAQPHKGHRILVEWERQGKIKSIITQNVDGFHHVAGSSEVSELHGTLRTCHCNRCGEVYQIDRFMREDVTCQCGGFLRPSVVLFGEALPEKAFLKAESEAQKADLFIVMGSSLSVSPANLFPAIAKRAGAKLVIINMDKTDMDRQADLVINGEKIGIVLQQLKQLS